MEKKNSFCKELRALFSAASININYSILFFTGAGSLIKSSLSSLEIQKELDGLDFVLIIAAILIGRMAFRLIMRRRDQDK